MCRFRLHICNWMHVCILNVSWSVSISAGTRAPGRSRARAQGQTRPVPRGELVSV